MIEGSSERGRDGCLHLIAYSMTHNSLARLPESLRLMEWQGLEPRVLAQRSLEFRSFINRDWLDELTARGLYTVRDGRAYETLYVVEATFTAR